MIKLVQVKKIKTLLKIEAILDQDEIYFGEYTFLKLKFIYRKYS